MANAATPVKLWPACDSFPALPAWDRKNNIKKSTKHYVPWRMHLLLKQDMQQCCRCAAKLISQDMQCMLCCTNEELVQQHICICRFHQCSQHISASLQQMFAVMLLLQTDDIWSRHCLMPLYVVVNSPKCSTAQYADNCSQISNLQWRVLVAINVKIYISIHLDCDRVPGLHPKPPSKFRQATRNSTAFDTLIAFILFSKEQQESAQ